MPEHKITKKLKKKFRNLADPGFALIIVYIGVIFFLFLFAGLEAAGAAVGTGESWNTLNDVRQARAEGKKTSLLSQQRPNIFTSSVANIGPGEEVEIEIEYQQAVHFSDGVFSLRFPMVIGPRYIPGSPKASEDPNVSFTGGGWAGDTDQVPDASRIAPPVAVPGSQNAIPVRLAVELGAGFPLPKVESLYHGIDIQEKGQGAYSVTFNGRVNADRYFLLEWEPQRSDDVNVALFAEDQGGGRYMLLMLLPPAGDKTAESPAREMIFVLDTSGSMAGSSIIQAKNGLKIAISRLRPMGRFNVIEFNSAARQLFSSPEPVQADAVARALEFVDGLEAQGGTEIAPALRLALDGRKEHDRIRQVVFLADGAVGNEKELLSLIEDRLGDSRLFTIGIGSAPNSYFMTRAAAMGRGAFMYIGKVEEVSDKMTALFRKLDHPVLSGVSLQPENGNAGMFEAYPNPFPDLYEGEPVPAAIRLDGQVGRLVLGGLRNGREWKTVIDTTVSAQKTGIAPLWAGKKIRNEMESLSRGVDREQVRKTVLATALAHHLVSEYTSLVAMEQAVSRPADASAAAVRIKTHLPQGWRYDKVFGGSAKTATPSDLMMIAGALLLLVALLLAKDRKQ